MHVAFSLSAVLLASFIAISHGKSTPEDSLLLNQIQFVGTFASAHQAPPTPVFDLLSTPAFQANFQNQLTTIPLAYTFNHLTVTEQLELGVRGFEFNLLADPQGGAYAYSAGLKLAGVSDTLVSSDLLQPGIKSMTLPDWDTGSSCYLFTDCLQEIANYSSANPNHLPIVIVAHHAETTNASTYLGSMYSSLLTKVQSGNAKPTTFSQGALPTILEVEAEVLSVFKEDQLYTPADLRSDNGASPTDSLRSIVLAGGSGSWPTVGQLRGKIIMMADPDYLPQLQLTSLYDNGTIFFASDDNGDSDPNVVFLDGQVDVDLYNSTSGSLDTNANAVVDAGAAGLQFMALQGFFIRVAMDNSGIEAKYNYTYRADTFQSSGGGQFLGTFYETTAPSDLLDSTYQVNPDTLFSGATAVCNPVTTGSAETAGSVAYAFDGAINQLGAVNIIQNPPACPIADGFSSA